MKKVLLIMGCIFIYNCGNSGIVETNEDNIKTSESISQSETNEIFDNKKLSIEDEIEKQKELIQSESLGTSPVGTWEINVDSPRGNQTNTIEIIDDNGKLKGITDKGSFYITQNGNSLSWNNSMDTPMGNMNTKNTATIDGDKISGTVEVTSGRATGRTMRFSGVRK